MKAPPQAQRQILLVQDIDLRLDRIEHREQTLPQHQVLVELEGSIEAAEHDATRWDTRAGDLRRQVDRVELDVEQARKRADRDAALLDSGSITSGKQLEELQHEIVSLKARIAELEDAELEVMEELETVAAEAEHAMAQSSELSAQRAAAISERDAALERLSKERSDAQADRSRAASGLPADFAALYEKLREQHGGVGAAELRGGRCGGCNLHMSATEQAVLRDAPADEVVRCDECRRILVREGV